jgi:hypothetical protein
MDAMAQPRPVDVKLLDSVFAQFHEIDEEDLGGEGEELSTLGCECGSGVFS